MPLRKSEKMSKKFLRMTERKSKTGLDKDRETRARMVLRKTETEQECS